MPLIQLNEAIRIIMGEPPRSAFDEVDEARKAELSLWPLFREAIASLPNDSQGHALLKLISPRHADKEYALNPDWIRPSAWPPKAFINQLGPPSAAWTTAVTALHQAVLEVDTKWTPYFDRYFSAAHQFFDIARAARITVYGNRAGEVGVDRIEPTYFANALTIAKNRQDVGPKFCERFECDPAVEFVELHSRPEASLIVCQVMVEGGSVKAPTFSRPSTRIESDLGVAIQAPPMFEDLKRWYDEHVSTLNASGQSSNRDDDQRALEAAFPGINKARQVVRHLRRDRQVRLGGRAGPGRRKLAPK